MISRFAALGDRPLHHDESIHAYQSYTLSKGGDWRYDPAYHGPFLYYLNALVYKICRRFERHRATDAGDLRADPDRIRVAAAALDRQRAARRLRCVRPDSRPTSPTSRGSSARTSIRWSSRSATILAFQRFLETDRSEVAARSRPSSFAFAGVTKENAYMTGVLFVAYGVWCLSSEAPPRADGPRPVQAVRPRSLWVLRAVVPIVSAAHALPRHLGRACTRPSGGTRATGSRFRRPIKYWMGQHTIARIPGPWYYYFPQLVLLRHGDRLRRALRVLVARSGRRDPFLRVLALRGGGRSSRTSSSACSSRRSRARAMVWIAVDLRRHVSILTLRRPTAEPERR